MRIFLLTILICFSILPNIDAAVVPAQIAATVSYDQVNTTENPIKQKKKRKKDLKEKRPNYSNEPDYIYLGISTIIGGVATIILVLFTNIFAGSVLQFIIILSFGILGVIAGILLLYFAYRP